MIRRRISYFLPIIILFASTIVFAQSTPSVLLRPLRAENAKTKRLVSEVKTFVNSGTTDKDKIRAFGDRLIRGISSNRAMIARYQNATTRFGLQEEYYLVVDMMADTEFLVQGYGRLTGVSASPPTLKERKVERQHLQSFLKRVLQPAVAQRLGSQGLADVLTGGGFEEVVGRAERRLTENVLEKFDEDVRQFVEIGVGGGSFETYARAAGRRITARFVATLIAKITTNSLVIDFIAGRIVRWVGATLKRALRNRGNLDARTTRSVKVLENAARSLNVLKGREAMSVVRLELDNAYAALGSTKFLTGDIKRARRTDLAEKMAAAIERLSRTIRLTEHRFLTETKMASLDLQSFVRTLTARIAQIREMQARMKPGVRDQIVAPDAPQVKDTVAGRYDGNCVRECHYSNPMGLNDDIVILTGSMKEVTFERRRIENGRITEVAKGRCKLVPGNPGVVRFMKGTGSVVGRRREFEVQIRIRKGKNGWVAYKFYGSTTLDLKKEQRGPPR